MRGSRQWISVRTDHPIVYRCQPGEKYRKFIFSFQQWQVPQVHFLLVLEEGWEYEDKEVKNIKLTFLPPAYTYLQPKFLEETHVAHKSCASRHRTHCFVMVVGARPVPVVEIRLKRLKNPVGAGRLHEV